MTISTVMDVLTGMLVLGAKVSTPIMGMVSRLALSCDFHGCDQAKSRVSSLFQSYCDWDDPPRGWPLDARYLRNLHHRYL